MNFFFSKKNKKKIAQNHHHFFLYLRKEKLQTFITEKNVIPEMVASFQVDQLQNYSAF